MSGRGDCAVAWVCLMFHDVSSSLPGSGGGPERFSVPISSFELILDTITAAGCVGCSLATALDLRDRPRVGITFDDGTVGQFAHAVPALRVRDMTATFFVTTDWIGTPGFMSWDQLRRLSDWGMSIQSHTLSHPFLSELGEERLRKELKLSKLALDRELGQETTQIALPGGNGPKRALRSLVGEAGYRVVAGSRWGRNYDKADAYSISNRVRRCTVPRSLTPGLARRVITGDSRLTLARYPREAMLNGLRAWLGATRYSVLRRRLLDFLADQRPRA